ncbi:MAG TPA: MFS transporter [Acidimicrobiia bacterium]|nr:MFS transporter [Acidimicrobiia bacterium]
MTDPAAVPHRRPRLLTGRFVLVVAAGTAYFVSVAMLLPVLPRYVEDVLGGGSVAVGVTTGSFFVGAVLLRPFAGRLGDRIGRRVLIVGGGVVVGVATATYGLVEAQWWVVLARVVGGVGEAAFFVGAATMITDLAPVERRGEAVSYWSVAVYSGLAFGPPLGEAVLGDDRYVAVWLVSAALGLVAGGVGLLTRDVARTSTAAAPARLLHPRALGPGLVLFLGLLGLAGFTAFVPLYVDEIGLDDAGGIFLLYGALILVVRVVGARLPDRLGARRAAGAALVLGAVGTAIMAAWASVPGLVVGTIVFAGGMSLMYPALLLLALDGVPDNERASSVGTISSFFDLSQGLGGVICGTAAALAGERGAFFAGTIGAVIGIAVLRRSTRPDRGRAGTVPAPPLA